MSWDKPWAGEGTARPRPRFFEELEHSEQQRIVERLSEARWANRQANEREIQEALVGTNLNWLLLAAITGLLTFVYVSVAGLDQEGTLRVARPIGALVGVSAALRVVALLRSGDPPPRVALIISLPFVVLTALITRRHSVRHIRNVLRVAARGPSGYYWEYIWQQLR